MENPTKIEPPAQRASRLQLERAAISEVRCDYMTRAEPYSASEGEIEHSKAISLKRIADVLERFEGCALFDGQFHVRSHQDG